MTIRFLAVLAVAAISCSAFFPDFIYSADQQASSGKITAYYFHGSFRCPTCRNMEQYSKEAIETNFKDSLASGKIEFKAVNVESKGNEHFVNDYQLYTKALIISMEENGKEVRHKNLDKIWDYARNKERFKSYVQDELAVFMKETQ